MNTVIPIAHPAHYCCLNNTPSLYLILLTLKPRGKARIPIPIKILMELKIDCVNDDFLVTVAGSNLSATVPMLRVDNTLSK